MFKAISWSQYGLAVFLLLIAYYAYVVAVYYRAEVAAIFKGRIGANQRLTGSDRRTAAESPAARSASSLIIPSLAVAVLREEVSEPEIHSGAEASQPAEQEDLSAAEKEGVGEQSTATGADEVALGEKADTNPAIEEADVSSLVEGRQLSEFLDKVENGEFTEENKEEAPAALENTALLQSVFAAGLARRRASLAVLEDL